MAGKGISISRAKTIYQRQKDACWDERYIPGILATPKEAPSISHAYILVPKKLRGREVHLLSTGERNAALLGLYHPSVIGLQEQRMLNPTAGPHPLWSHPAADRSSLKHLAGVIETAEQLGMFDELPVLSAPDPSTPGARMSIVYPWCGDLLWAIHLEDGGIGCINWNIKDKTSAFSQASAAKNGSLSIQLLARYEIEAAHYASAGIRTVSVANEQIDEHVSANLRQLFLHHGRKTSVSEDHRQEIICRYQSALSLEIPPSDVIAYYAERNIFPVDETRTILFQAIWNRDIRVDLFKPILINRPMRAEERDVLDVYRDWFDGARCT